RTFSLHRLHFLICHILLAVSMHFWLVCHQWCSRVPVQLRSRRCLVGSTAATLCSPCHCHVFPRISQVRSLGPPLGPNWSLQLAIVRHPVGVEPTRCSVCLFVRLANSFFFLGTCSR